MKNVFKKMSGVGAPERQNLGLFYIVTLCFYLPLLVLYNSVKYFPSGLFKLCLCCLQQEVIAPAATLLRSVTFTMEALYKRTWTHGCIKVLLLLFNFLYVWLHRRWEMWNCNRTEQLTENLAGFMGVTAATDGAQYCAKNAGFV